MDRKGLSRASLWLVVLLTCTFGCAAELSRPVQDGPPGPPPPRTRAGMSLDLNGAWRAQPATSPDAPPATGASDWGRVNVPGPANLRPGKGNVWKAFKPGALPAVWLERDVSVPAEWKSRRVLLRSELIEQPAVVFVDGRKAGVLAPPGDGLDLTGALAPSRKHVLRLFLARGEPAPAGAAQFMIGYIGPLGVAGSLRLDALAPRVAIDDVFLMPSTRTRRLGARIRLYCDRRRKGLRLRAVVTRTDGAPVRTIETKVDVPHAGPAVVDAAFPWADPVLWELDRPHLYRVTIEAIDGWGGELDAWGPEVFGFREFWIDGRRMMLNGHPCRFRLLWHWGVGPNNLAFYQGMGFNAVAIQPRDGGWFTNWGAHADIERLAGLLDRRGMALIAPSRTVDGGLVGSPRDNPARSPYKDSPRLQALYRRANELRIWRYANHPSILVWNVGLNSGNDVEEYVASKLGRAPAGRRATHPVNLAAEEVDRLDPTRTVMAHASGNLAPVTSANSYLNFIPLQEREEWLSAWAKDGTRPWSAIEHGTPYIANFYRKGGPEPLFTENCAMFLGDEAYRLERTGYVRVVEHMTRTNTSGHGSGPIVKIDGRKQSLQVFAAENTGFFPVVTEFVRRTNRAWRAWGHNAGSHPWMWNIGFGGEPAGPMNCYFYTGLKGADEQLRRRPDWANPYYDVYRETMQPLLVWIGGRAERFTERDHVFFPGERVEKQIVAIWDGGWRRRITARWRVTVGGAKVAGDAIELPLGPGEIRMAPLGFTVPKPARDARGRIELVVDGDDGKRISTDAFRFRVIPRAPKLRAGADVLLWDPKGESAPWIRELGLAPKPWKPGQPLGDADVLIVGRNALTGAAKLPYALADLDRGLRVLILEQQLETLRRFGFRVEDTYSRRLFPRDVRHPVLRDVDAELLEDWRGSATLLPDTLPQRLELLRMRGEHWGNYAVVASAVIEVPHRGNFTPIIDGEFDLRYSPLLEWPCGRGRVIFSQLDFTGRVGADPAATRLARNLLAYVTAPPEPRAFRKAVYVGGPVGRKLVADTELAVDLDVTPDELPEALKTARLVIVGEGVGGRLRPYMWALRDFVHAGGLVFSLPKRPEELRAGWLPFAAPTRRLGAHRVGVGPIAHRAFRGLGPADFHWRDFGSFDVFTAGGQWQGARRLGNGFFLWMPGRSREGGWLLSQADPGAFSDERAGLVELRPFPVSYYGTPLGPRRASKPWLRYTRQRTDRMYAQILANLGAAPGSALRRRMTQFVSGPKLVPLEGLQMAGPYPGAGFDTVLPPEPGWADRSPGKPRPKVLWKPAADLATRRDGPGPDQVVYFRAALHADRDVRVPLRLHADTGADVAVWCDGRRVLRRFRQDGYWGFAAGEVMLSLRKGDNEVRIKVRGEPSLVVYVGQVPDARLGERGADLLYRDPRRFGDDPYYWIPW